MRFGSAEMIAVRRFEYFMEEVSFEIALRLSSSSERW
jgi:hypothetical protein